MKTPDPYSPSGVEYRGEQKRLGTYPLDCYHDLQTESTFCRMPFESIFDAVDRVRKPFKSLRGRGSYDRDKEMRLMIEQRWRVV